MKTNLVLLLILFSLPAYSQFYWTQDLQVAKAKAIEEGKLIVVDFWAVWCGPCKEMDEKLWARDEMHEIAQDFIPLKINIDYNRPISRQYAIRNIPTVLVIDAKGEVLWRKEGLSNITSYLGLLAAIPTGFNEINPLLYKEGKEATDYFYLGKSYQTLARENQHSEFRTILLNKSNQYFKKAKRKGDQEMEVLVELHQLLNKVYAGRLTKAQKALRKMDTTVLSKEAQELRTFIQAYCCKVDGASAEFKILKQQISDEKYLTLLE